MDEVKITEKDKQENLVKKTCRELGITQKELAERIGLTDRTLSKYATSNNIPKNIINHINLLVESLNKTTSFQNLKNSIQEVQKYI